MSTMKKAAPLGLALLLALAGCGNDAEPGVATAGKPTAATPTASRAATGPERQRQYVACLRSNGAEVQDQQPGQPLTLSRPNDPRTRAAVEACRSLAPTGDSGPAALDPAAQRTFAACMRRNGVADFPDPDPDRGLQVPKTLVNRPEFQTAWNACKQGLKPGGK